MRKIDFLFVAEHTVREENTYALLCAELRRRGYTAEYMLSGEWERKLHIKPKVFIFNCFVNVWSLSRHAYATIGQGNKLVEMHWEQVFPRRFNNYGAFIKDRQCDTAMRINKFCWGELFADRMRRAGVEEKYLFITGHPAFDFLTNKFNAFYKNRDDVLEEFGIEKNKKIILYIADFGGRYSTCDGGPYHEEGVFESYCISNQTIILDWFEIFIKDNPDYVVIYRPHPVEVCHPRLEKMTKQYSRFKIIREYSVQQWMKIVDCVFTTQSTSIVEVYFLGIACGVLRPVEVPKEEDYELYDSIPKIRTYDEFNKNIQSAKKLPINNIIEKTYANRGTTLYGTICDLLEDIYRDDDQNTIWDECDLIICKHMRNYWRRKDFKISFRNFFRNSYLRAIAKFMISYIAPKNYMNKRFWHKINICAEMITLSEERKRKEDLIEKCGNIILTDND